MKHWLPVALALLLVAGLIGWRVNQKRAEAAEKTKQQTARGKAPAVVQAARAERRDIVRAYETVGSVESPNIVNLSPQVSGRLIELTVDEGDAVTAGQVIARLDPAEIETTVRSRAAAVAQAEQRLAEAELTQNAGAVTVGSEVRKQRAALGSARAALALAQANEQAQIAAARSAVTQAEGQIDAARALIGDAEAAVLAARSALANARTNRDRQAKLVKEGASAQANLDNAETQEEIARATLEQAEKRRDNAAAALRSAVAARDASRNQVTIVGNQARAAVSAAKSVVTQAAATLTASEANTATVPAYRRNLAALRATVEAARADLRTAEAQRGYTVIRSPLTGVVTRRGLDPGGLATPGQTLVTLQAVRQVWMTAGITEEASRRVYIGQEAACVFDALPGQTFRGRVTRIAPAADPQSRQFPARIRLDNPGYKIKPGMFGRVRLETERIEDALVVPREAVKFAGGGDRSADPENAKASLASDGEGDAAPKTTVTVIGADGAAKVRPVTVGATDARFIAVTAGLEEGEQVVILSGRPVRDGQAVKVAGTRGAGGGEGGPPGGGPGGPGGPGANGAEKGATR